MKDFKVCVVNASGLDPLAIYTKICCRWRDADGTQMGSILSIPDGTFNEFVAQLNELKAQIEGQ